MEKPFTKENVRWHVWPTHWAGGSSSVQVDGINTLWIDSYLGEICRFPTIDGKVTTEMYKLAQSIVNEHNKNISEDKE